MRESFGILSSYLYTCKGIATMTVRVENIKYIQGAMIYGVISLLVYILVIVLSIVLIYQFI